MNELAVGHASRPFRRSGRTLGPGTPEVNAPPGAPLRRLPAALLLAGIVSAAPPAAALRYEIDARLDPEAGRVEGSVRLRFEPGEAEPGTPIPLRLYPKRFLQEPPGLDQRNRRWIYPGGFDAGDLVIDACTTDDGTPCRVEPGEGEAASLIVDAGPDTLPAVTLRFRTHLPERFGFFGKAEDVLMLGGGWHPLVASTRPDAPDAADGPIDRADYFLVLHFPAGTSLVVDGRGPFACEDPDGCRVERTSNDAEPPSVFAAETWYERHLEAAGIRVRFFTPLEPPDPLSYAIRAGRDLDPASVPDLWAQDRPRRALETAAAALRQLESDGWLPAPEDRPDQLALVQVPLRLTLTAGVSDTVVISDQAYELFPLEPFWRFQDVEIERALLGELYRRTFADRPLAEARWSGEAAAEAAVEQLERTLGAAGRAEDLLVYGSFVPIIDQMMFAPVNQFRDAYFPGVEESDTLREELWRFGTPLPRGRRVWAKLRDRLGEDAAVAAVRRAVEERRSLRETAGEGAEDGLADFWPLWLGPYPELNLVLLGHDSEPLEDGSWRTTVQLRRDGDSGAREFVTVRVALDGGETRDVVWDAREPEGEVTLVTPAPAEEIELDPDGRVIQNLRLAGNNPRADDTSSLSWRLPVLEQVRFNLDLAEIENSQVDVMFMQRRRYDILDGFRGRFTRNLRGLGGMLAYVRGFGMPRDANRPTWGLNAYLQAFHYDEDFGVAGGDATMMDLGVIITHDSKWFDPNPENGWMSQITAAGSFPVDDSDHWTLRLLWRQAGLWTPAAGHTLGLIWGYGFAFGNPVEAQLETVGGRQILRGFAPDEGLGRAMAYAVAEYRHLYSWNLDLNLLHLARLRGIQGVLFLGAATSSRPDTFYGLFTEKRMYFEAGYGLRAFFDWAGVQTGLLALDLAVPFVIDDGSLALSTWIRSDPDQPQSFVRRSSLFGIPFGLHFTIVQTF